MKLDRPVLIEGRQKNTLLVSIDLIIKNTRNKVLLGCEMTNPSEVVGSFLVLRFARLNFIYSHI